MQLTSWSILNYQFMQNMQAAHITKSHSNRRSKSIEERKKYSETNAPGCELSRITKEPSEALFKASRACSRGSPTFHQENDSIDRDSSSSRISDSLLVFPWWDFLVKRDWEKKVLTKHESESIVIQTCMLWDSEVFFRITSSTIWMAPPRGEYIGIST